MKIIETIVYQILFIFEIIVPISVIVGAIIIYKAGLVNDVSLKTRKKKLGYNIIVYPIITAILIIVIWGFFRIVFNS